MERTLQLKSLHDCLELVVEDCNCYTYLLNLMYVVLLAVSLSKVPPLGLVCGSIFAAEAAGGGSLE